MITAGEIRNICQPAAYRQGRRYFQDGDVKEIQVTADCVNNVEGVNVSGKVQEGRYSSFHPELYISVDDEILDYSCNCYDYETYWGMCYHCVALALEYQSGQKQRRYAQVSDALAEAGIVRSTSEPLKQMMYRCSVKNRMNHMGGLDGEIRLECFFQPDKDGLMMECRIGAKRMYVVKNLVKLVRDVEEMRQVRYGANLEFVHDLSAFSEEGREIFALVEKAVVSRYPDYQDSYYEYSSNFRYILLRQDMMEHFLDHFLGGTIRLEERDVSVVDGNPPLTIALKETMGGAELTSEDLKVYTGGRRTFVYKDGKFWRCTKEFAEQVLPVWQVIDRGQNTGYRKRPLFLSRADYGSFCGNVLPALKAYVTIKSGKLNLEDYAPVDPEFSVYLGMPGEQVVEARARVRYDEDEFDLLAAVESGGVYRNLEQEQVVRNVMQKYFRFPDTGESAQQKEQGKKPPQWADDVPSRDLDEDVKAEGLYMTAQGEEALYRLLDGGLAELESAAELFVDESIRKLNIRPAPKVTMGIGFAGDFLNLDVQVEGMAPEEIAGILDGYRRRRKYYRMKSGDYIRLENSGLGVLSELSEGLNLSEEELKSGHVEVEKYRALYLENVLSDSGEARVRKDTDYRRLIRDMRQYADSEYEEPENLQAELRTYQRQGFQWLHTLYDCGFGGILADDMGLGKTLQMIALILKRKQEGNTAPSLVVSPASLVYNWESEVRRFAPELSAQVIAGNAEERKRLIACAGEFDVNITSYDLLKRDIRTYKEISFDCCVIDEAQYIKNAGTQSAKSVKKLKTVHRFALTGTPIENRLSDLWSIFDFLMPGYLYSYRKFRDKLEAPIVKGSDEVAVRRLQQMVTPFILRRKKQDVLKDLPDKLEKAVYVHMTPEQERVYRASVEKLRMEIQSKSDDEIREKRLQILAELTRLRQICCSPALCFENYAGGSGKILACLELLKNAMDGGHKILVFSQFTSMLDLLIREWKRTGKNYRYLSGKDSKLARRRMVEEFQTGDIPVFFISLKAGGTGLNLTAADVVIHCDPWWNVAAQNQATDRAHRIGQDNVVNVMKLVAKDTIEEKILRLQEKKAALADSVVEGEGVRDFTLNREELMELFQ